MKLSRIAEFDATDRAILELLQENCKQPLAAIGEKVGLSAPSVVERIHKLEEAGVITDYVALVDARRLGKDVTAFIGVCTERPRAIGSLERQIASIDDVLECHHVTGAHTLMVKVKTENTASLEDLIERVRSLEGVQRTETMVVLSTHTERPRVALDARDEFVARPSRRPGGPRARGGRQR
jgi:Lrp/AsnC family leucine-responsive transcriptional regulator